MNGARRVLAALAAAGFLVALAAPPARAGQNPGTAACALSEDGAGNLVAAVTGLSADTDYGFYVFAPLPDGTSPEVTNGQFVTDSTGGLTFAVYQLAPLMSAYPGETSLVFSVYPINKYPLRGNRDGALTSCAFTPA